MSSMSALLRCLLVPLQRWQILVPSTCVTEVVPFSPPTAVAEAPVWMLGTVEWRTAALAAIDLDGMLDGQLGERATKSRWAIMRAVSGGLGANHYAVLTRGLPRLVTLERRMVVPENEQELPLAALSRVRIGGQLAYLPALEHIESEIVRWGSVSQVKLSPSLERRSGSASLPRLA